MMLRQAPPRLKGARRAPPGVALAASMIGPCATRTAGRAGRPSGSSAVRSVATIRHRFARSTCARVAGAILCILFDGRRPVDQISKEGRSIAASLEGPIRQFLETGVGVGADLGSTWGSAADEEIDRVFGEGA